MSNLLETEQRPEPPEIAEPQIAQSIRPRRRMLQSPRAITALVVLFAALVAGGFSLWRYYSVRESTDDAQIEGHIHPISAKVGGTVIGVNIRENQYVEAGSVLVRIDPKDYQVALEKAQADYAEAQAMLSASRVDVPITATSTSSQLSGAEAGVMEAQANLTSSEKELSAAQAKLRWAQAQVQEAQANYQKANRDLDRMKQLISKDEISQQQYDAAVASAAALQATVESAQADVARAEQELQVAQSHIQRDRARVAQAQANARAAGTGPQQVAITRSRAQSAEARLKQAKAALDQAQLNMDYTTIKAPVTGLISKKSVEEGQIVQVGQPLFAIIPLNDVWVDANFKETQLRDIRPGQPVSISVDAYGRKFKGHVESIAAATGAKFSLLPPENATGNYVKVVQRVPVRILFEPGQDPDHLLRPGMSVVPTVITK